MLRFCKPSCHLSAHYEMTSVGSYAFFLLSGLDGGGVDLEFLTSDLVSLVSDFVSLLSVLDSDLVSGFVSGLNSLPVSILLSVVDAEPDSDFAPVV